MEKNLTTVEIVGVAIVKERQAQELYEKMSKAIKNPLVSEKFHSLSREEKKHEKILTHMYLKMTGEQKVSIPPIKDEIIEVKASGGDDSFDELFVFAIEREKEAQRLYMKGAEVASDESGRRIFRYLADFERGHELILVSEFENYKRDKEWYATCPDIMLEGP